MDYRSLQHAIAVAEEGSFVKAADKVALTQSAVSRSILNLENALGATLFDRTAGGVRPTAAGQVFLQRARKIVADIQTLQHDVDQAKTEISGKVAFGAVPSLAAACLPDLLTHCVRQWPRLGITAKVEGWSVLRTWLQQGEIEFAIIVSDASGGEEPNLVQTPIGAIGDWGLFCRPDHPLTAVAQLTPVELQRYPLAIASMDKALDKMQRDILQIHNNDPWYSRLVSDSLFLLQRVVCNSDALLLTAQIAMQDMVATGLLVELPVQKPASSAARGEILVAVVKGRSLSPAATYLIDQLKTLL